MSDTNGQTDNPAPGGASDATAAQDQGPSPALRGTGRGGENTASAETRGEPAAATDNPQPEVTRVPQRGDSGYKLRPGDLGYAPPARIAHPTGMLLTREHLGYTDGHQSGLDVHGQVPLAMPSATPTVHDDLAGLKPSQLGAAAARVSFAKMVGGMQAWVLDLPHEMTGELAVVANFFRELAARRAALGTAAQLGRTVAPDAVDDSVATPPPEYFILRNAAQQMRTMRRIYESALNLAGGALGSADQQVVNGIAAGFDAYADGPKHPGDVVDADVRASANEKESATAA